MSTRSYHLTCKDSFYGVSETRTYYNVPFHKVNAALRYMSNRFNSRSINIYLSDGKIGHNTYIGYYSTKYRNFTLPNGVRLDTYNF